MFQQKLNDFLNLVDVVNDSLGHQKHKINYADFKAMALELAEKADKVLEVQSELDKANEQIANISAENEDLKATVIALQATDSQEIIQELQGSLTELRAKFTEVQSELDKANEQINLNSEKDVKKTAKSKP